MYKRQTNQYFGGVVADKGVTEPVDEDLKKVVLEAVRKVDEKMDKLRVADAITEIFNIFRRSNKYIDETTPVSYTHLVCDEGDEI